MTAVLVCDADTPRPEWLEARRAGIGASEIAAVIGISPWESPFSLYWRKREGWETEASDEMATGTRLEPVIADWWGDVHDPHEHLAIEPGGLYRSAERPWQMATPDRLIHPTCAGCDDGPPEPCCDCLGTGLGGPAWAVLECKWTSNWDGWGEPGGDDIPVYYRTQVLQQCDVMGVDEWHLAVLGPSGFRAYQGKADPGDVAILRAKGAAWWTAFTAGIEPDIDAHSQTLAVVRRLHPDITDEQATVTAPTADGYRRAQALASRADATKRQFAARLRREMGGAKTALHPDGRKVASRSVNDRLTPARSPK